MSENEVTVLLGRAFELLEQGNLNDSYALFERICDLDNTNSEAWKMRGAIAGERGVVPDALSYLDQSISLDSQDATVYFIKAKLLLHVDRLDEAEQACSKAVEKDADYAEYWLVLGGIQAKLGRFDEAETNLRRALVLAPDMPEAKSNLGLLMSMQGSSDEAVAHIKQHLKMQPNDVVIRNHYAKLLLARQEVLEAIKELEQVLTSQPKNSEAHYSMGLALERINDYPGATSAFRCAIQYNSEFPLAHLSLAVRLMDVGAADEATAEFQCAIRLQPDMYDAYIGLATHLIEQDRPEQALTYLQDAERLSVAADLYSARAGAHEKLEQVDEALADRRRAMELAPDSIDFVHHYALAVHRSGDTHAALDLISRFQETNGPSTALLSVEVCLLAHIKDARAAVLFDYDRLVISSRIEVPINYASAEKFIQELRDAVLSHPTLTFSPASHSTRNGDHTGNLFLGKEDVFSSLEEQVRQRFVEYVNQLDVAPEHPLRAMITPKVRSVGWAVVMRNQGHQVPHVHPDALISGVCYLQLPDAIQSNDVAKEGWIEFGQAPDDFACDTSNMRKMVKPEIGMMILFPSYIFHRTVPFHSDTDRISLAFDIILY